MKLLNFNRLILIYIFRLFFVFALLIIVYLNYSKFLYFHLFYLQIFVEFYQIFILYINFYKSLMIFFFKLLNFNRLILIFFKIVLCFFLNNKFHFWDLHFQCYLPVTVINCYINTCNILFVGIPWIWYFKMLA